MMSVELVNRIAVGLMLTFFGWWWISTAIDATRAARKARRHAKEARDEVETLRIKQETRRLEELRRKVAGDFGRSEVDPKPKP